MNRLQLRNLVMVSFERCNCFWPGFLLRSEAKAIKLLLLMKWVREVNLPPQTLDSNSQIYEYRIRDFFSSLCSFLEIL